jgi:hypothetical protein
MQRRRQCGRQLPVPMSKFTHLERKTVIALCFAPGLRQCLVPLIPMGPRFRSLKAVLWRRCGSVRWRPRTEYRQVKLSRLARRGIHIPDDLNFELRSRGVPTLGFNWDGGSE